VVNLENLLKNVVARIPSRMLLALKHVTLRLGDDDDFNVVDVDDAAGDGDDDDAAAAAVGVGG